MPLPPIIRLTTIAIAAGVAGCASPTGSGAPADIAAVAAELRMATTHPVVRDLFRFTSYVLDALLTDQGGCRWTFEFTSGSYQPMECGTNTGEVIIYAIVEPDLPHRGTAIPLGLPLVPVGALQLTHPQCVGGITVTDGLRTLLEACPGPGTSWSGSLYARDGNLQVEGERQQLSQPDRTRHMIRLIGTDGAEAVLEHDIISGIERSESVLLIDDGRGTVLRLEGYAGATGPAYEATLNGEAAGAIAWQGSAGFVTTGPHAAAATAAEDLRLRETQYLIQALSRLGVGAAALVGIAAEG
jgi:hypothetical protein